MATTIQATYDELAAISSSFTELSGRAEQLYQSLRNSKNDLHGEWEGYGWSSFDNEMENELLPGVRKLSSALQNAGALINTISSELLNTETAGAQLISGTAGNAVNHPLTGASGAYPTPINHPLTGASGTVDDAPSEDDSSRRGSRDDRNLRDERSDRRDRTAIESDRRWRRDEGGNGSNNHWNNDWAGRSILDRYLTGGGDWSIENDSEWAEYMQGNDSLTQDLGDRAMDTAEHMFANGASSQQINESFPMQIENGEGIVGYQYLHGTNADVGGFERSGTSTMTENSDGTYTVRLDMEYTWNDVIDPNPQYSTDRWKSTIAEVITLGQADPYDIHITWNETTIVDLDANGNVTGIRNED